jgi:hypothetical protein
VNPESNVIPCFFSTAIALTKFNDVIDLDDMVNEVPNKLGLKDYKEQSQVNFLDSGSSNPEESQPISEICTSVDVVQDNPIVGNDANTIATTPPILGNGV